MELQLLLLLSFCLWDLKQTFYLELHKTQLTLFSQRQKQLPKLCELCQVYMHMHMQRLAGTTRRLFSFTLRDLQKLFTVQSEYFDFWHT